MAILNLVTFFIHFNLALGKSARQMILIQITESIRNSIDNNEFGYGIFIDLKKAFEKVNHSILLSKLNHYGVRDKAYDWFQSYLSNREQFVCINGHKSDSLSITCGVPQGSAMRTSRSISSSKIGKTCNKIKFVLKPRIKLNQNMAT